MFLHTMLGMVHSATREWCKEPGFHVSREWLLSFSFLYWVVMTGVGFLGICARNLRTGVGILGTSSGDLEIAYSHLPTVWLQGPVP